MKDIENIRFEGRSIAMVIKADCKIEKGIKFLTSEQDEFQVGIMRREKKHSIKPHSHLKVERLINTTSECLFLKSGKVNVTILDENGSFICDFVLNPGDILIQFSGGHAFDFLEDSELVEVKQGPYVENEKVFL